MPAQEKPRIKISVVIPTYKRPELLLRCIHALRLQSFPAKEFEIIIVSDGYDPASYEAAGRFDPKDAPFMRYHNLQKKAGPAAARNHGWQRGLGELIAFTDDDCIPDNEWLAQIWKVYQEKGISEIAFTGRTKVPVPSIPTDYEQHIRQLEHAEFITANCACTRKALLKVGGFDERFTMAWREDRDLQFKLLEKGVPIVAVETALVTHPVRKARWGISIKEEKKGIFNALLYKKYPRLYREKIQPSPPWLYYFILLCFLTFLTGIFIKAPYITYAGLILWICVSLIFAAKRLASTRKSLKHITEMIVTSLIIPFLSIFYRFYGSLKYGAPLVP